MSEAPVCRPQLRAVSFPRYPALFVLEHDGLRCKDVVTSAHLDYRRASLVAVRNGLAYTRAERIFDINDTNHHEGHVTYDLLVWYLYSVSEPMYPQRRIDLPRQHSRLE